MKLQDVGAGLIFIGIMYFMVKAITDKMENKQSLVFPCWDIYWGDPCAFEPKAQPPQPQQFILTGYGNQGYRYNVM